MFCVANLPFWSWYFVLYILSWYSILRCESFCVFDINVSRCDDLSLMLMFLRCGALFCSWCFVLWRCTFVVNVCNVNILFLMYMILLCKALRMKVIFCLCGFKFGIITCVFEVFGLMLIFYAWKIYVFVVSHSVSWMVI